jgi:hypothetical protein
LIRQHGHLVLLADYGSSFGHAMIIYGVGFPDTNHMSVFDPMGDSCKYSNMQWGSVTPRYVGWRAPPGAKAPSAAY